LCVNGHADDARKADRLNLLEQRALRIANLKVLTLNAPASKNPLSEDPQKNKRGDCQSPRNPSYWKQRRANRHQQIPASLAGMMRRNGVGISRNNLAEEVLLLHEAVSDRLLKSRFGNEHGHERPE